MNRPTLIHNIGSLVTNGPLVEKNHWSNPSIEDLGIIQNAWLLVDQGKIIDFGPRDTQPLSLGTTLRIDAEQRCILPGLIDCHTHPLFAGSRSHEFAPEWMAKPTKKLSLPNRVNHK